jgi:hypothetical protein
VRRPTGTNSPGAFFFFFVFALVSDEIWSSTLFSSSWIWMRFSLLRFVRVSASDRNFDAARSARRRLDPLRSLRFGDAEPDGLRQQLARAGSLCLLLRFFGRARPSAEPRHPRSSRRPPPT